MKKTKVYQGKPCLRCGNTKRYLASDNCAACVKKRQEGIKALNKSVDWHDMDAGLSALLAVSCQWSGRVGL